MERKFIATAAFLGMTAIIFDAFGAHKLKELLDPDMLAAFKTGARYQIYHAFLLLFVGIYAPIHSKAGNTIYWLTILGVLLFSGSLYLLSTGKITGIDFRPLGWITPIGGTLMIAAWLTLFVFIIRKKS